jgi:hypothetical protein
MSQKRLRTSKIEWLRDQYFKTISYECILQDVRTSNMEPTQSRTLPLVQTITEVHFRNGFCMYKMVGSSGKGERISQKRLRTSKIEWLRE